MYKLYIWITMYIILSIVVFIILLELYVFTKSLMSEFKSEEKNDKPVNVDTEFDKNKFNKYSVLGDKKINHGPGKIMILDDNNIFINTENYNTLMKKKLIYNITTPFELEILNVSVSNENIIYYYISNE